MEVLVLGVAQRSLPLQDELAFAETWSWMKRRRPAGLGELGAALLQLVRRLQALRLQALKYILKALALANSGEFGACTDGFLYKGLVFNCDGEHAPTADRLGLGKNSDLLKVTSWSEGQVQEMHFAEFLSPSACGFVDR